ncbi:MAG: hypothetical protein JWO41_325 [Candidatus Saccharibacteria bacterium]|nr:hypothetical protein [Candidatus Saccharibacteria bacterium]
MINDVERLLHSSGHPKHLTKKSKSVNDLKQRPIQTSLPSSEFEETDIS